VDTAIWVAIIMNLGGLATVIVQGRVNARKTSAVVKQVYPNGGSSMADAVNRAAANSAEAKRLAEEAATRAAAADERIDGVSKDIGAMKKRLDAHLDGR
jgi:hypothetical protein